MKEKFTIKFKGATFNCEFDKIYGRVWIFLEGKNLSKTSKGQVRPAENIDDAMEIAIMMLKSMGF